jgi:pyruvate formate lyase activating enzyme
MMTKPTNFPTKYWHKLANNRIQCDLCPQACQLNEGKRGLCFVRMRENDTIVLTTFGRSSGFCIDPVEKKPLNHFLPGSSIFSFGTAGCNLCCKFCQNWDISKAKQDSILANYASPKSIVQAAQTYKCNSIAFTYNEPTIFMEYAIEVAKICRPLGIKTVAVTNGYINPEPRKEFYSYIDAANVDLKAFTESFYHKTTSSHLQPVLDTLKYLKHETNVWLEITCLLIPGENDSANEIETSTKWVVEQLGPDVPMHFTGFHPAWKMLDTPATSLESLIQARNIALKNGIRYPYTGNLYHPEGSKTFCHNCHNCIIARDSYTITTYHLDEAGNCKFCNTKCAGVFSSSVGNWNGKIQPVFMEK